MNTVLEKLYRDARIAQRLMQRVGVFLTYVVRTRARLTPLLLLLLLWRFHNKIDSKW